MEGDIGKYDMYQGEHVPLDCPMMFEEKDVELNKPKVGGKEILCMSKTRKQVMSRKSHGEIQLD